MLFSATATQKIEDLARLALKKEPITVGVENVEEKATVEGLEQGKISLAHDILFKTAINWFLCTGYVVCPAEKRMLMLFSFLKRNRKKKIMVFFSSCMSVKFHHELFNYIDLPVMCIHVRALLRLFISSWTLKRTAIFLRSLGQTKADQANDYLFPVLQRWLWHPSLYGCCCQRFGHSRGGLDCTVRSPRWS